MGIILHQFDFYRLRDGNYFESAILIAEKTLVNSEKLLIVAPESELSDLSYRFWSEKTDSFLAHGMGIEDVSDYAPIWLSTLVQDNPISADYVMLTNGASLEDFSGFKRVFNLFDGSSQIAMEQTRNQWRNWSANPDHLCRYFTQSETGTWQHIASNTKE